MPEASSGSYPMINGVLASLADCEVYVVGDNGERLDLLVDLIEFKVSGNGEPATATIRLLPESVEAEALWLLTWEEPG